jgi:tetratricopeptide (TPR) repeat protein
MILQLFNAREAAELGAALANEFALQIVSDPTKRGVADAQQNQSEALEKLFQRADREVRHLRLNFYKKAKFANSFKWQLLESGIERKLADEVAQMLVAHISVNQANPVVGHDLDTSAAGRPSSNNAGYLLAQGNKCLAQGAYAEAIEFYQDLIKLNPRNTPVLNVLGKALWTLGRYDKAEDCFRQALKLDPKFAEAHGNLGKVLMSTARPAEAENWLRQALKLQPILLDARNNLGFTLVFFGRLRDAKAQFNKVLKRAPRNSDALFGIGYVAAIGGHFDEAEAMYKRALKVSPKMSSAWAGLVELRRMTSSDSDWLRGAEELAASGITPLDEATMRFAIGKYYDDVENFKQAFQNYQRGNEVLKAITPAYDHAAHTSFVDDMATIYTRETCARLQRGGFDSSQPVFVVGMPRSGTSLTEQIIASHPAAKGAGELNYWSAAFNEHEMMIRSGSLDESTRKELAERYLRLLHEFSGEALRVVDKAPVNSDYLGLIHSVFPKARVIYMRRDPIDTCLSCYFQKFAHLNFTLDLTDLAQYYREHRRLMDHWKGVLPSETLLEVPYEGLVSDQEGWTRKILDFLGLEWDERCLNFHKTERAVVTSSYWQVRQTVYRKSITRWRNYASHIGPLLSLGDN